MLRLQCSLIMISKQHNPAVNLYKYELIESFFFFNLSIFFCAYSQAYNAHVPDNMFLFVFFGYFTELTLMQRANNTEKL